MNLLIFALLSFYTPYKYSNDILSLFDDPKSLSLGGEHAISMDSSFSAIWNSAFPAKTQVGISHYSFFGNFLSVEGAGLSGIQQHGYFLSIFAGYVHSQNIELTSLIDTTQGVTEGNIKITNRKTFSFIYFKSSLSKKISGDLYIGNAVFFYRENLPDYAISGIGIDAGLYYPFTQQTAFAVTVNNIIASTYEMGEKQFQRPVIKMSALFKFARIHYYFTLSGEYDGAKEYAMFNIKNVSLFATAGMEYLLSKKIVLRMGSGKNGIGMGAGIHLGKVHVNYGMLPAHKAGISHKLSISYSLEQ